MSIIDTTELQGRFGAFVAERFPFALGPALDAFASVLRAAGPTLEGSGVDALATRLRHAVPGDLFPTPHHA